MGDSFAAGPGCGCTSVQDERDCRRRDGTYPQKLQSSNDFQNQPPNGFGNPTFWFKACTGDETPQVNFPMKDLSFHAILVLSSVAFISLRY